MFKTERKKHKGTQWGDTSLIIHTLSGDLPEIYLKITNAYNTSNNGYVDNSDIKNPKVFILINKEHFYKNFKLSIDELYDTLKHEIRHYLQFTGDENTVIGLPKKNIKDKNADIYGRSNGYTKPHYMQDIEFKTNVHTYAHYLKSYLNKNYSKKEWFNTFKKWVVDGLNNYTNDNKIDFYIININHLKRKDKPRWKQFVIELYKEIFK